MRFPYLPQDVDPLPGELGAQTIHDPVIYIRVIGPERAYLIRGLLDTGAHETLLPLHLMDKLGLPRGGRYRLGSASGLPFSAWLGRVDLEIFKRQTTYRWSARVGFAPHRERALLGHSGFLDHFTATFDGRLRRVTLRPNGTFPEPIMSLA